ncbi:MAG: ChrR family anti-sigma-E factor [Pseudomonadota bacterium]
MLTEQTNSPELRVNDILISYASGAASAPTMALVDAHLELRPDSRDWVDSLAHLGGALMEEDEDAPLSDRDAMLSSIFEANGAVANGGSNGHANGYDAGPLPKALAELVGMDFKDIPWKTRMPGLKEYRVPTGDDTEASLLWIKAGTAIPVHTHEGTEATLVLQGAFSDGEGFYGPGDIAVADDTVDHRPVAEPGDDCICFAVCDAPLRLTGPIGRFISPFMR